MHTKYNPNSEPFDVARRAIERQTDESFPRWHDRRLAIIAVRDSAQIGAIETVLRD